MQRCPGAFWWHATCSVAGNQATYSSDTIPAGYQTLTVQLLDGSTVVTGAVDVVRVVAGQTTTGSYSFSSVNSPGGSVQVNITPALADPIPVSISGVGGTIAWGTDITASASVSDGTSNVVYVWYLNGASVGTGATEDLGSGLAAGYYRLDVTGFTADGARAGSASVSFQVTGGSTATHVYIAGTVGTSVSSTVPVYWKDGALNYLPLSPGNPGGGAYGIAEDRFGNLYVAGGQKNASSFELGYWMNSRFVPLSLGSFAVGYTAGIAVDTNGNVWTEGYLGATNPDTFVYWENSQGPFLLPPSGSVVPGTPNSAWGMLADTSGNVYFTGSVGAILPQGAPCCSNAELPFLWKNGGGPIPLLLSGGNNFGDANGIGEDGSGNLYMAGNQWSLTGGSSPGPVYWRTAAGVWQSPTRLRLGPYSGDAFWAIQCIGFDASNTGYVAGAFGSSDRGPWKLVYWKGLASDPVELPLPAGFTFFFVNQSIAFDANGNSILDGEVGNTEPDVWSTTITDGVRVYWQNENPILLPMGAGNTWGRAGRSVAGP